MTHDDKWTNPREAALDTVRDAIEEKKQTIESGPLEGTEIVTIEDIAEAFRVPLEPVSDFTSEVRTPGLVYVAGVCPNCKEVAKLRIDLTTELRIDSSGRHMRLKGKSKEVTHYCGQRTLDLDAEMAPGQIGAFDLEDIINRTDDQPISPEELQAVLMAVGIEATIEAIESWTEPDRETVRAWAVATHRKETAADEETAEGIEVTERPSEILSAFDAIEVEETKEEQTDGDGDSGEADPGPDADQPKPRRKR
jgi:hypothetical protein